MLLLNYKRIDLPFEYPFEISKAIKTTQRGLLVSLGLGKLRGYGEMTAISYYPESEIDSTIQLLESKRKVTEGYSINSPQRFFHFLHHLIPENTFLMSALDIAAWDLWAKMKGLTVQQLMEAPAMPSTSLTNYTIGIHDIEKVIQIIKEKPYDIYKLKLDKSDPLPLLQAVKEATSAKLRLDVNEGWDWDSAQKWTPQLKNFNIELIEQPFPAEDIDALKNFKNSCSIPVIADEACKTELEVNQRLDLYDGINIKLSKFGGITPALEIIEIAKQKNKKILLGGMCESYIGATATAQLIPYADYIDIDGPLLLKENFGKGIAYEKGMIHLPQRIGMGTSLG